jgi:hypothetical protein
MFSPVHSREQRQRGGGKERDEVVILHEADLLGCEEEAESTGRSWSWSRPERGRGSSQTPCLRGQRVFDTQELADLGSQHRGPLVRSEDAPTPFPGEPARPRP